MDMIRKKFNRQLNHPWVDLAFIIRITIVEYENSCFRFLFIEYIAYIYDYLQVYPT